MALGRQAVWTLAAGILGGGGARAGSVLVESAGGACPLDDVGSLPDSPGGEVGGWCREVGVLAGELVDALGGEVEHGGYFGDADEVEGHGRRI